MDDIVSGWTVYSERQHYHCVQHLAQFNQSNGEGHPFVRQALLQLGGLASHMLVLSCQLKNPHEYTKSILIPHRPPRVPHQGTRLRSKNLLLEQTQTQTQTKGTTHNSSQTEQLQGLLFLM